MDFEKTTTIQMGRYVTQITKIDNDIFAKLSPIMKYLGYYKGGSTQYSKRIVKVDS